MIKKKYFFIFILTLFVFSLAGCSQGEKLGKCHLRDKRFACEGSLQADGQGSLQFTSAPKGNFYLSDFELQEVEEDVNSAPEYYDCQGGSGKISTDRSFNFKCQGVKPGAYYVMFDITHEERKNYKPLKGEVCELWKGGGGERWKCKTGGEFKYVIQ